MFRVLSTSGNIQVTIRDGSDIDSPVILNVGVNVGDNTLANPLKTVMTTGERIVIEIRNIGYPYYYSYYNRGTKYNADVKFELLSVTLGKLLGTGEGDHKLCYSSSFCDCVQGVFARFAILFSKLLICTTE